MANIQEKYEELCRIESDINEHLPTLKKYAEQSETVIELGVRGIVSTWAILAGKPKSLISVDIEHPKTFGGDLLEVYDLTGAENIDFRFILKSSLEVDIPERDFLFIDTIHTYEQLIQELEMHHEKTKKFIGMHDTNLYGDTGMKLAVNNFLDAHQEWEIAEHFDNNNGMTFLKRV